MSQRHIARIVVMQTIFSIFHRPKIDRNEALSYSISQMPRDLKKNDFPQMLLEGIFRFEEQIKNKIKEFSSDKSLEKIDPLTMAILYIGTFELCFDESKQPPAVIINEAIELAKEYGKDTSSSLVNAILSKMVVSK